MLKTVLGFDEGYIVVFRGREVNTFKEWFQRVGGKFHKTFGWYIPSNVPFPEITPYGLIQIKVNWIDISKNNETLKSDKEIENYIEELYEPLLKEWKNEIGITGED